MKFNYFILTSTIFLVSQSAGATVSFEEDQAASSGARNLKPAEVSFVLQYSWFSVSILLLCTVCACANVSVLFVFSFRYFQHRVCSSKRTNNEDPYYPNRGGFILTKEQEQQTLIELREARASLALSESQSSDLQQGARSVAIQRFSRSNPATHISIDITYGPNLVKPATVDTGGKVLIMNDFVALQAAQPDIVVIYNNTSTPWSKPAKFVKGKFTLHVINSDGSQEDLTLETEFYACDPICYGMGSNNIGLSNGFGSMSPLKKQQGIEHMTFDLPKDPSLPDRLILQPAYKCNDLDRLWIDGRDFGNSWPFVFVNSLKVDGVQTEWAQGTNGPPQTNGNTGTMGMFDTGGGPVFLATDNKPDFPTLPLLPHSDDCRDIYSWFFDPSKGYEGCACYYGDVEFQLESAAPTITKKTLRWTNDDVVGNNGAPSFVACKKANLGGGNYVNLGTVMFALNKVTMSVNTYETCVESVAPSPGGLCEGICQGTSATHFGCRADVPGSYALGCDPKDGGCYYRKNETDPYPNEGFCTYKVNYGASRPIEGPKTAKKAKKYDLKKD